MSSDSNALQGGGDAASSSTELLFAILKGIGASEFFQNFIDDDQDDDCIASYKIPSKVCRSYGLPQDLAESFVQKCRLSVGAQRTAAASMCIFSSASATASSTASTPAPASAASATVGSSSLAFSTGAVPPALPEPPITDDVILQRLNFKKLEELGKGGFGTVYKCTNLTTKKLVAVKIVSDPKNALEALHEGQRLMRVLHENIVHMYNVHKIDMGSEVYALEMEVVLGGDLFQHLEACRRHNRRLPPEDVLRFSRQILKALVYLHDDMNWLHGDIKPGNMLLQHVPLPADGSTVDYSAAQIKLADFGLAKILNQQGSTQSMVIPNATAVVGGGIKGTERYLSPEALQSASSGSHVRTAADDLWSACLVICEMDTGLTLQQLMTAPGAIRLEQLLTKTSRVLLPLLASVLAVSDAALRCKSAAELLQKLDASADPLYIWEEYDATAGKYACMHPAASFVLETAFLANEPLAQLPLQPPLDLNFDIKALLSSATALGSATERRSGAKRAIRRLLKPSALTSSCEIPIWQQLVDGKEWLQCSPATCAKLETDASIPSAAPDSKLFRRIVLQPGSIGSAQLPLAMNSEPYCAPAQADDIAILSRRVHDTLPEWDISDMVQVWNPALASKYADYRHRLASRGNGDPNEQIMFHFAPPAAMTKIWQQGEGHDPRLSNWAEVGKGAYFSTHPMYGYAYKYSLWPSPPGYEVKPEPPIGETMQVFASLVCLGNVADMGPGCETCPSPAWDAWKQEPPVMPKPTRPPAMTLPASAAEKKHVLDLMQVKDTPRYDSVTSSEGDLGTHPASTNKDAKGRRICEVMHPRLRARAKEWAQQCVLFDTAASYPMFIATLTKARDSPVGAQQLVDLGCDAKCIKSLGFNASDVKAAGQSVQQMRDGGWELLELKNAGFDSPSLVSVGYDAVPLMVADVGYDEVASYGWCDMSSIVLVPPPSPQSAQQAPGPKPSTSHPVTRIPQRDGDNLYMTLHMRRVDDDTMVEDDGPLHVPAGWQIADGDADDIRVCGAHPWQSLWLMFANGDVYWTGLSACMGAFDKAGNKFQGNPRVLVQDGQGVRTGCGYVEVLLRRRA